MQQKKPSAPTYQIPKIEIIYRPKFKLSERPKVTSSMDAYDILMSCWDKKAMQHHEDFKILLLNVANRVLGVHYVARGGLAEVTVDPKIIFQPALLANANSFILAHNHPSGELHPSTEDITFTKKIRDAGALLSLSLFDHLIISNTSYYSFTDQGTL
jgi:DNA repair protein RadC